MAREWYDEEIGPHLYHVTWYGALRSIARRGLVASGRPGIAPPGTPYATYSSGKIFATAPKGVLFWYGRSELHASDRSDDTLGDGLTPVVLRIPNVRRKTLDEWGTRDAMEEAFILTRVRIPPAFIDAWDGKRWIPVRRWRRVDPRQAYTFEVADDEELAWFKTSVTNPLIPPVWR